MPLLLQTIAWSPILETLSTGSALFNCSPFADFFDICYFLLCIRDICVLIYFHYTAEKLETVLSWYSPQCIQLKIICIRIYESQCISLSLSIMVEFLVILFMNFTWVKRNLAFCYITCCILSIDEYAYTLPHYPGNLTELLLFLLLKQ